MLSFFSFYFRMVKMLKKILTLAILFFLITNSGHGSEIKGYTAVFPSISVKQDPSYEKEVLKLNIGSQIIIINTKNIQVGSEVKKWHFIDLDGCDKKNCGIGWVKDEDIALIAKLKKLNQFKTSEVEGEIGDYYFKIKINIDASYTHTYSPCIDCGEANSCRVPFKPKKKPKKTEAVECSAMGHLYSYRDLILAKETNEAFFLDSSGILKSVYSLIH